MNMSGVLQRYTLGQHHMPGTTRFQRNGHLWSDLLRRTHNTRMSLVPLFLNITGIKDEPLLTKNRSCTEGAFSSDWAFETKALRVPTMQHESHKTAILLQKENPRFISNELIVFDMGAFSNS
eukprot:5798063-Amphidinium_carterae.1